MSEAGYPGNRASNGTGMTELRAALRDWSGAVVGVETQPPTTAELVACLPTVQAERLLGLAIDAHARLADGSPRATHAAARARHWAHQVALGQQRDRQLAERRALGPSYEECLCLGQGGAGGLVAAVVLSRGRALAATDAEGRTVLTWETPCPCPDGLGARERIRSEVEASGQRYRARRVRALAGVAEIPRSYDGLTLRSWVEAIEARGDGNETEAERAIEQIRRWEREVAGDPPSLVCLLLLAGDHGVGKSGLAAALAHAWVARERGVLYRSAARLATDLRAAPYRAGSSDTSDPPTEAELLAAYQDADLLVLDDLGTEAITPSSAERLREALFLILDRRLAECRPTIVTSNLTRAGLTERVGSGLADRLRPGAQTISVVLRTPSLRRDER